MRLLLFAKHLAASAAQPFNGISAMTLFRLFAYTLLFVDAPQPRYFEITKRLA